MSFPIASDRRLLNWLENDPSRLERYLIAHPEVEARLEVLTRLDDAVRTTLRRTLELPEGLLERLAGVARPVTPAGELRSVVFDLVALPWHVARTLASDDDQHS